MTRSLVNADPTPTVSEVDGRLVINWPEPQPRQFQISAEAFEMLIAHANGEDINDDTLAHDG